MLSQSPQNSAIFLLHIPFLICARNRWPVVLLGSNLPAFDKKEGKGLCIESSKNNIAWPNWNMRKVKTFIYVTGNLFPSFHSSRSLSCQECPSIWQRSQHENISPGYINLFQCPLPQCKVCLHCWKLYVRWRGGQRRRWNESPLYIISRVIPMRAAHITHFCLQSRGNSKL